MHKCAHHPCDVVRFPETFSDLQRPPARVAAERMAENWPTNTRTPENADSLPPSLGGSSAQCLCGYVEAAPTSCAHQLRPPSQRARRDWHADAPQAAASDARPVPVPLSPRGISGRTCVVDLRANQLGPSGRGADPAKIGDSKGSHKHVLILSMSARPEIRRHASPRPCVGRRTSR